MADRIIRTVTVPSLKKTCRQFLIIMYFTTPTPTNLQKKNSNTPMTRKRRRELEAGAGAENDSATAGSAGMDTPTHTGKRPKQSSKATSKQVPGGKGKAQLHRGMSLNVDSDEEGKRVSPSKPPTHRAVTRAARKAGALLGLESDIIVDDDPLEDTAILSLKTPLVEPTRRLGVQRDSMESPPPQNARRGLQFSNAGFPMSIPSSRSISEQKVSNSSKILVRIAPEPPKPEPVVVSSSLLSPLTDSLIHLVHLPLSLLPRSRRLTLKFSLSLVLHAVNTWRIDSWAQIHCATLPWP